MGCPTEYLLNVTSALRTMRDLHFHFSRSSSDLHLVDVSYAITLMLIRVRSTVTIILHLKWTIAVASLHQLELATKVY